MTPLIILLLISGFTYVAAENRWNASNLLVKVSKLYAVPAIVGLMAITPLALEDSSNSWVSGEMLAQVLVVMLCVAYVVMVGLTAALHAGAEKVSPNRNFAVFMTIILLFLVLLSGALMVKHL